MRGWLATAKTVGATVLVTSAAWLIGGALWLQHERTRWQNQSRSAAAAIHASIGAVTQTRNSNDAEPTIARGPATTGHSSLTLPVAGVQASQLTDTFTQAREGGKRVHDAIDIMAPRGAPVLAAAPGTVEKLFYSVRGGNTVYVRSPDRTTIYYYAHLDAYAPGLAEKQEVRAGQPLGTVGFSGDANPAAPHLHFAIMRTTPDKAWYQQAEVLNPYPLLTR